MRKVTVDFGDATFTDQDTSQRLQCSVYADLHGETRTFEDGTVSARTLCQEDLWVRCRTPLSFSLLFAFDQSLLRACNFCELQQALTNLIASESVWLPIGLNLANCYSEEASIDGNIGSFNIILSFEPSASAVSGKSNKRWRRVSSSTVNDVNTPSGLQVARLDAVTITCSFAQLQRPHATETTIYAAQVLKDSCVALTKDCISSILGTKSRPPISIRRETNFEHTLRDAVPSIFSHAYTRGISQRSLLVPSITRALAAFQNRTTAEVATTDETLSGCKTPATQHSPHGRTTASRPFAQLYELQLWRSMLGKTRAAASLVRPQTRRPNNLSTSAVNTASAIALCEPLSEGDGLIGSEGYDMEQSLFAQNPDQARALSVEFLGLDQRGRDIHHSVQDTNSSTNTSFEELAETHMLMVRDDDVWTSYRESDPASSQDSAVPSDLDDQRENLHDYEDYDKCIESYGWADIIGQREQLTQISGREDPLFDPLLRRDPGHNDGDVFLEDLLLSNFSSGHSLHDPSQAVAPLDDIILDSTAIASTTTAHKSAATEFCELPEPDAHDRFPIEDSETCSDLFGTLHPDMRLEGTEMEDWRSRLASPDISDDGVYRQATEKFQRSSHGPSSQPNRRSPMSRSFLKRASTISTSSSSESGPPRRHRSILQRLSRSSSTKSKHEDSDVSDLEYQVTRGREVEIKRRKTLDDYTHNEDGEDDEMLFV